MQKSYLYFGRWGCFTLYSRGFRDGMNLAGFGSPGTGKTAALIIPNIVRWIDQGGSVFCIDISGDITGATPDTGRALFAPWGVPTGEFDSEGNEVLIPNGVTWDVLAPVRAAENKEAEIEKLAAVLAFNPDAEGNGMHWVKESTKVLTAVLCALVLGLDMDFVAACEVIFTSTGKELFDYCLASQNNTAKALASSLVDTQGIADKFNDAKTAIKLFATPGSVSRSIQRGGLKPSDIETQSLFFFIPDKELEESGQLVRLVAAQMWDYLAARPLKQRHKILAVFDEFGSLGILPIKDALQKFRKRHVSVMYFMQSVASLDIYGTAGRRELLGATQYTAVLDATDTDDQKQWSDKAGEYFVKVKTETRRHTTEGENQQQWSESTGERRERRIAPDEFALLPSIQKFALFHRGGVVLVRPRMYFKDRNYKRICSRIQQKKVKELEKNKTYKQEKAIGRGQLNAPAQLEKERAATLAAENEQQNNRCCYAAAKEFGWEPWTPAE